MSAQSTSWCTLGVVLAVSQLQIVFLDTPRRSPISRWSRFAKRLV